MAPARLTADLAAAVSASRQPGARLAGLREWHLYRMEVCRDPLGRALLLHQWGRIDTE